jgi:hypothetical protein
MSEKVLTLVKIPLSEIVEWMRAKHTLPSVLTDSKIEEESLVLYFSHEETALNDPDSQSSKVPNRRRRTHKKRNRMKTRGWAVIARITNSKGQNCAVYKPFVDALQDPELTREQQSKKVEEILRSNKNKPTEASIQYFLENTLE